MTPNNAERRNEIQEIFEEFPTVLENYQNSFDDPVYRELKESFSAKPHEKNFTKVLQANCVYREEIQALLKRKITLLLLSQNIIKILMVNTLMFHSSK